MHRWFELLAAAAGREPLLLLVDDLHFADETAVAAFDSMKIGKRGKVVPFSNWVKVNGSWFHLRPKDGDEKFGLRPVNSEYFKVGKIKLKWTAPKATKVETCIVQVLH